MNVEQAFGQALEYEAKIRDQYFQAASEAPVAEAAAFYKIMGQDESSHVEYIKHKLAQWKLTGRAGDDGPASVLPPATELAAAIDKARSKFSAIPEGGQMAALQNALKAEIETSGFYRSLAGTLPAEVAGVFERLLEIEDGHTAIVQAELDMVSGTGHWFDVREFTMED